MCELLRHLASLFKEKEKKIIEITPEAWEGLLQSFREVNLKKEVMVSDGKADPALVVAMIKRGIKEGAITGWWKELDKPDMREIISELDENRIRVDLDITWRRFEQGMEAYQQWMWGALGLSYLGYGMVSTVESTNITEMMEKAGKRITQLITEIYDAYRIIIASEA